MIRGTDGLRDAYRVEGWRQTQAYYERRERECRQRGDLPQADAYAADARWYRRQADKLQIELSITGPRNA